ncbi:MAG: hypothetical protein ABI824_08410 [Acidobacteriota bacterium]
MRFLSFGIVLAALATVAHAGPITYIETGEISGRLGTGNAAISLTNTSFSFTFNSDTANIFTFTPGVLFNPALSNSITIGALSGSFTEAMIAGLVPGSGLIGMGGAAGDKAINFSSAGAVGYGLVTPISVSNPAASFAGGTYSTTLGDLVVTGAQNLTFTAVLGTPEPGTIGLSVVGLLALAGTALRRSKLS